MSANERLGIQLFVEPPKDDASKFLDDLSAKISLISKALEGVDLSKVGKGGDSAAKAAKAAAEETAKLAKETENAAKKAELLAKGIVPVEGGWSNFVKANKEAALAMTGDWHKAQQAMSDSYKKFNADKLTVTENTEKTVRATLAATIKVEEQNNQVRAAIIRNRQTADDQSLAAQIRNAEKQREVWEKFRAVRDREEASEARKQTNVNMRGMRALDGYQIEQQQLRWNQQANTQGVKYQPVDGGGFVRSSVQTTNLNEESLRRFRMEADKINLAFKSASEGATGFFSTLKGMAARLAEFYSLRTILFTIASDFKALTAGSLDLNQKVHDILAISGDSKDQYTFISDAIYGIAKASRFTALEVADLMQVLAQAGIQGKDLGGVSAATGMFATATASDPKMAADLVTTSMNVFGIKATEVTRITNAMTAALNLSKLETAGLSTAFNYLGPQAAQLGMSMEQTLAIIANMAQSGIKPSTIGTGTSQMLKEFAAPKPRLAKLLADKGLEEDAISPLKHSFAEIVETLQKADIGVDRLFSALESRVGRATLTAINLTGASFREMEANVSNTRSALIAYDKSMEGARARMNVVSQTIASTASNVGNLLSPAILTLVDMIKSLVNILSTGDGKLLAFAASAAISVASVSALGAAAKYLVGVDAFGGIISIFSAGPALMAKMSAGFLAMEVATVGVATGTMGLKTALQLLFSPTTLWGLALTALAASIGGILYWLGAKDRAFAEEHKKTLQAVDDTDRLGRSYQSILKSKEGLLAAQEEYSSAMSKGNTEAAQTIIYKNRDLQLSEEQRKELTKALGKDGIWDKQIQSLIEQNRWFEVLIATKAKFLSMGNKESVEGSSNYNKAVTRAKFAAALDTFGIIQGNKSGIIGRGGTVNEPYFDQELLVNAELKKSYAKASEKEKLADLRPLAEQGVSSNTGSVLGTHIINPATGKSEFVYTTPKDKPTPDKGPDSTKDKDKNVEPVNMDKVLEKLGQRADKQSMEDTLKILENKASLAKDAMKDLTDPAIYDTAKKSYISALAEVETQHILLSRLNALDSVAADMKATYDNKTGNFTWDNQDGNNAINADNYLARKPKFGKKIQKMVDDDSARRASDRGKAEELAPPLKEAVLQEPPTARLAKEADFALKATAQRISLAKEEVWTAQEREKLERELQAATTENAEKKVEYYAADVLFFEEQQQNALDREAWDKEHGGKLRSAKDLHEDTLLLLEAQRKKMIELSNLNPWASFTNGVRDAWKQQTDVNAQSKALGSSMTNSAVDGTASAIVSSTNTVFNQDKEKVSSIKTQINQLNTQKTQLTAEIAAISANTTKTPQEVKDLADKKVALDNVNNSLKEQQKQLRQQTNAWASFASGMKNAMVMILKSLQEYIAKLIAVALWNQIAGVAKSAATSMFGGTTDGAAPATAESVWLGKADGGMIPLNMGKSGVDSVPAMLMPGEVIIKKSSVDYYGANNLLALNDQKLQKFANGGLVGGGSSGASGNQTQTIQIVNIAPGDQVPNAGENTQQIINVINADIARRGPTFKSIKAAVNN